MRYCILLFFVIAMSLNGKAQEIETTDKFASGYINGTYMNKFKSIEGVLYAVGYEGTKDWILVRYPAGSRNTIYHVHPNCRRIARGAFEGASFLQEIYLPETVSFIGDDAFSGCISLQGIYYEGNDASAVSGTNVNAREYNGEVEEVARYNLSGRPCKPYDKGVQIVVYSDFTTKTIIVE